MKDIDTPIGNLTQAPVIFMAKNRMRCQFLIEVVTLELVHYDLKYLYNLHKIIFICFIIKVFIKL